MGYGSGCLGVWVQGAGCQFCTPGPICYNPWHLCANIPKFGSSSTFAIIRSSSTITNNDNVSDHCPSMFIQHSALHHCHNVSTNLSMLHLSPSHSHPHLHSAIQVYLFYILMISSYRSSSCMYDPHHCNHHHHHNQHQLHGVRSKTWQ